MFKKVYSQVFDNYELIDAGGGKKIERFGKVILIRPEIQSYFKSSLPFDEWRKMANAEFLEKNNKWLFYKQTSPDWQINIDNLSISLKFTSFKHIGIFPEQYYNWNFLKDNIKANDSFLNLFAYTGVSSLIASKYGAKVCHVDSVKSLIDWANENSINNGLKNIKWVLDDALAFAKRETNRQNKYDFIWMDPPAFGYGKNGKKWILNNKIEELVKLSSLLLNKNGKLVINTYSPKLTLYELKSLFDKYFNSKKVEEFELWQKTKNGKELYYGNCIRIS